MNSSFRDLLIEALIVCCLATMVMGRASADTADPSAGGDTAYRPNLVSVRHNERMPWNAVVVDVRGRVIVSAPRWTGNTGPAVAIAQKNGELSAYPDASWNSWRPGGDASKGFVSVNAIHEGQRGEIWIVDTGSPDFGGTPVNNGAKIVKIDSRTDSVTHVYPIPKNALRPHTYVDDIRINGNHAYLTDAGEGAILVLNLDDGSVRRVFDGESFARARPNDVIVVNGKVLRTGDGQALHVNADPLELSTDGKYLIFGPLSGPLSQIETRYLDDDTLAESAIAQHVTTWFADMPAVGGTAMGADGNFYYTPLADNSLMRRAPDGTISTVVRDKRLRWVDAPFLDGRGNIFLPVPQIDGAPAFNHGKSTMTRPFQLFRLTLPR
ncbi:major royal jelly family protein [Paraburkholderia caribensis]|uniref:major royal jelly family protein n=1 Tax=Paraburkholderia caribensis TaxID=75105 RepID=UPI001F200891|nr:major royal jelly family protein [Paraburkholderia caribensis]